MAFKFRLASIGRMRASFERREKLLLMLATNHLSQLQQSIAALDAERREARAHLDVQLEAGLRGGEMHFYAFQDQARKTQRRALLDQAARAEVQCQKQQVAYTNARRAHEMIERLRARALSIHLVGERRLEQQTLDELHLQSRLGRSAS